MSLSASRLCQEILKLFSSLFPSLFHAHSSTLADSLFLQRRRAVDKLLFCSHASWCRGAVSAVERRHASWERRVAPAFSPLFSCCFLPPSASVLFRARRSHGASVLRWNRKTRISDWIEKEETHCDLCLELHPGSNPSR